MKHSFTFIDWMLWQHGIPYYPGLFAEWLSAPGNYALCWQWWGRDSTGQPSSHL